MRWEYQHINIAPDESHFDVLRANGRLGWEA